MLFLWWFGHEMEEMYGTREFLIFYLVSAFLGGVAYFLWSWARDNPVPCVGASGAVTAVMVLYAFHFPTRVIRIWYFLPVPIWLFVVFQVGRDFVSFASGIANGTAVTVHLAGAAFGFGYYKGNWRLAPLWQCGDGPSPAEAPAAGAHLRRGGGAGAAPAAPAPAPVPDRHHHGAVAAEPTNTSKPRLMPCWRR